MAQSLIEDWSVREVVSAAKLNRVRDGIRYLADSPRLSCRGAAPGQSVPRGKATVVKWSSFSGFRDSGMQWFTVPDSGVYVVNATITIKSSITQPAGDGVIMHIYRRAPNGSLTTVASVREIVQQDNDVQVLTASGLPHLVAGEALALAVYLDAGSPSSSYALQSGEWEGLLSAWLRAPGPAFTASGPSFAPAESWTDRDQVTAEMMRTRITRPFQALAAPPRVACRGTQPLSASSGATTRIAWSPARVEQSGGWTLSRDGRSLTVPASGVYLVGHTVSVLRDGPDGFQTSYQAALVKSGSVVSVRQRQTTRGVVSLSMGGTDPLYLKAGDTLSVDLLPTGNGVFRDFGNNIPDEQWNSFYAVMLAPGATSMRG